MKAQEAISCMVSYIPQHMWYQMFWESFPWTGWPNGNALAQCFWPPVLELTLWMNAEHQKLPFTALYLQWFKTSLYSRMTLNSFCITDHSKLPNSCGEARQGLSMTFVLGGHVTLGHAPHSSGSVRLQEDPHWLHQTLCRTTAGRISAAACQDSKQ